MTNEEFVVAKARQDKAAAAKLHLDHIDEALTRLYEINGDKFEYRQLKIDSDSEYPTADVIVNNYGGKISRFNLWGDEAFQKNLRAFIKTELTRVREIHQREFDEA